MPATTVVLFGATGDLAKRKLLPGLLHLSEAGLLPSAASSAPRSTTSTDELPRPRPHASRRVRQRTVSDAELGRFAGRLHFVPGSARAPRRWRAVAEAEEQSSAADARRLHYLSVPPKAALRRRAHARARPASSSAPAIIMEKPFGTDLASARGAQRRAARGLRRGADLPHRPLPRQGGGAEHPRLPLRQRPVRADLEPQPHRPRADRRARDAGPRHSARLLRDDRRLPRHGRHPPLPGAGVHGDGAADRARARARSARRRTRSSARCCRSSPPTSCAASTSATATSRASPPTPRPRRSSRCKCEIDNWRWAGVPFFLRTGKRMAEGARIISIAFREPPRSMFPPGSGRRRARARPPDLRPRRRVASCRCPSTASGPARA